MNTSFSLRKYVFLLISTVFFFSLPACSANNAKPSKQIEQNMKIISTFAEADSTKYIQLAKKTMALAKKEQQDSVVTRCYRHLVSFLLTNANAKRAYPELLNMRAFVEETGQGDDDLYISWQNTIVTFFRNDNPLQAMTEFHEMHKYALSKKHNYGLACSYTALGCISEYAYNTGIENFNLALKYMKLSGHRDQEYYIYYQMADLAHFNGRYAEAQQYLQKMLECPTKPALTEYLANYMNLFIYGALDNKAEATKIFKKMEAQWNKGEIPSNLYGQYAMSMCYYICKYSNPDGINKYIDYISIPEEKLATQIHYNKAKGNFEKAFHLQEHLDSLQRVNMIAGQQAKVINATAFYKSKELTAKNMALEFTNTIHRFLFTGVVQLLIILAAIFIAFSIRRHNKQLKAERDRTEEERKKAVRLSEMKTTFINNMSHEVRTPLNSIIGFNELLNNPGFEYTAEERSEMLGNIHTQTNTLTKLLNDVIFLSRIDGGDVKPSFEDIPLKDILGRAFEIVEDKIPAGVSIDAKSAMSTDIRVNTDKELLTTAVTNILDNAVKFTKEGQITFGVEKGADDKVNIIIANPGERISEESAKIIFERFEKLGRYNAGFGLGLSIAEDCMKLIGGAICLDTEYTEGARFIITL